MGQTGSVAIMMEPSPYSGKTKSGIGVFWDVDERREVGEVEGGRGEGDRVGEADVGVSGGEFDGVF